MQVFTVTKKAKKGIQPSGVKTNPNLPPIISTTIKAVEYVEKKKQQDIGRTIGFSSDFNDVGLTLETTSISKPPSAATGMGFS